MNLKRNHPYLADAMRAGAAANPDVAHIAGAYFIVKDNERDARYANVTEGGDDLVGACALGMAMLGEGVGDIIDLGKRYPCLVAGLLTGDIVSWNDKARLSLETIASRTLAIEKSIESEKSNG